ncbi:MAG: hypothetical protein RR723_04445, partial [Raoultibacter sp.]
ITTLQHIRIGTPHVHPFCTEEPLKGNGVYSGGIAAYAALASKSSVYFLEPFFAFFAAFFVAFFFAAFFSIFLACILATFLASFFLASFFLPITVRPSSHKLK